MHATPTVAYRSAGGTLESVAAGMSGLLVDEPEELTDAVRGLLTDTDLRASLGDGARAMSHALHVGSCSGVVRARRTRPLCEVS